METQKWEYKVIGLSMFNRLNTYTRIVLIPNLHHHTYLKYYLVQYIDGYYLFKRPKITNGQERGNTD